MIERAKLEKLVKGFGGSLKLERSETEWARGWDCCAKSIMRDLESLLASPEPQAVEVEVKKVTSCITPSYECLRATVVCDGNQFLTDGPLRVLNITTPGRKRIWVEDIEPERTWRVIVLGKNMGKRCEKCGGTLILRDIALGQCTITESYGCGTLLSGEITWEAWREEKR